MNIKKLLRVGLLISIFAVGSNLSAAEVFWVDKGGTKHQDNIVSVKSAKSMVVNAGTSDNRETRIIVTQKWGCLCLLEGWEKKHYEKLSDNSVRLDVGNLPFVGAELGFVGDNSKCVKWLLGKKGCTLIGNREDWAVEQKNGGSWSGVASGWFMYVE